MQQNNCDSLGSSVTPELGSAPMKSRNLLNEKDQWNLSNPATLSNKGTKSPLVSFAMEAFKTLDLDPDQGAPAKLFDVKYERVVGFQFQRFNHL